MQFEPKQPKLGESIPFVSIDDVIREFKIKNNLSENSNFSAMLKSRGFESSLDVRESGSNLTSSTVGYDIVMMASSSDNERDFEQFENLVDNEGDNSWERFVGDDGRIDMELIKETIQKSKKFNDKETKNILEIARTRTPKENRESGEKLRERVKADRLKIREELRAKIAEKREKLAQKHNRNSRERLAVDKVVDKAVELVANPENGISVDKVVELVTNPENDLANNLFQDALTNKGSLNDMSTDVILSLIIETAKRSGASESELRALNNIKNTVGLTTSLMTSDVLGIIGNAVQLAPEVARSVAESIKVEVTSNNLSKGLNKGDLTLIDVISRIDSQKLNPEIADRILSQTIEKSNLKRQNTIDSINPLDVVAIRQNCKNLVIEIATLNNSLSDKLPNSVNSLILSEIARATQQLQLLDNMGVEAVKTIKEIAKKEVEAKVEERAKLQEIDNLKPVAESDQKALELKTINDSLQGTDKQIITCNKLLEHANPVVVSKAVEKLLELELSKSNLETQKKEAERAVVTEQAIEGIKATIDNQSLNLDQKLQQIEKLKNNPEINQKRLMLEMKIEAIKLPDNISEMIKSSRGNPEQVVAYEFDKDNNLVWIEQGKGFFDINKGSSENIKGSGLWHAWLEHKQNFNDLGINTEKQLIQIVKEAVKNGEKSVSRNSKGGNQYRIAVSKNQDLLVAVSENGYVITITPKDKIK